MTEELYGYVTLGIWLTMVLVAAAGLWPRKRVEDSAHSTSMPARRRQRDVVPSAERGNRA